MDPNLIALLALGWLAWKKKQASKSSSTGTPASAAKSEAGAPVPPGYVSAHHTTGLHGEPGIVYVYPNHDEWFVPDNHVLAPYHIPGGQ